MWFDVVNAFGKGGSPIPQTLGTQRILGKELLARLAPTSSVQLLCGGLHPLAIAVGFVASCTSCFCSIYHVPNYIEPERLAELILEARRLKTLTPELCQVVVKIASGVHSRYGYRFPVEDLQQEAVLIVCLNLGHIDLEGQPFYYLSSIVKNIASKWSYHAKRRAKMLQDYRWTL